MAHLKSQASNLKWPLLAFVLAAAAFLRLGWPGLGEFKYDEAMISRRAIDLVRNGIWPASTISSIPGIPQPPLKALVLAIPYVFTRNPAVAIAFQGVLGVMAVLMTYLLAKRYFGDRVGLVASALLAFAPWVIFHDRKLWSQNVPIFTLIMMAGLYALVIERKPKIVVVTLVALGLLIGFYLGNVILAGIVTLALVLYHRSLLATRPGERLSHRLLWLAAGVIGLIITLTPYLIEFISGRADLNQAAQSAGGVGGSLFAPLEQMQIAAHAATGYQFHALAGDQFRAFYRTLPIPDLSVLDYVTMGLMLAAMVYVVARSVVAVARRHSPVDWPDAPAGSPLVLLALWIVVPIAAWAASGMQPWLHRYIMMYPAQHLAVAVMLVDTVDWFGGRWPRMKQVATALVVIWVGALAVWQTAEYLGMLRFVSTRQIVGGYGHPVRELWAASEQARRLAGPRRLPIVVHTDGADPEHQQGPAQFDAVLGDFRLYLLGDPRVEVAPAGKFVWIADHGDGTYSVEVRTPPPPSGAPGLARLANGVDLLRVTAGKPIPGQPQSVSLVWRIWSVAAGKPDYGYTVQLYDADEKRWGQVDGEFVRSLYWGLNDEVTVSIDLPVDNTAPADGEYHLLVAMYAYLPDSQLAVDILDIAGNPAGQSAMVPLN